MVQSHYLKLCWDIVDWNLGLSGILIGIKTFSIQENAFENVICKMADVSSQPQCVNRAIFNYLAFSISCLINSHLLLMPFFVLMPNIMSYDISNFIGQSTIWSIYIDVTWVPCCGKSLATLLFVQMFVRLYIKAKIKFLCYRPFVRVIFLCERNSLMMSQGGFPSQMACNAKNVSMSWCYHVNRISAQNTMVPVPLCLVDNKSAWQHQAITYFLISLESQHWFRECLGTYFIPSYNLKQWCSFRILSQ